MAGGASTKVVFTLPLPSYFPLPYQFSRTLSLFTPLLLYLLEREGSAQTPFITCEYFSSPSLFALFGLSYKNFYKLGNFVFKAFDTCFLRSKEQV
jgi:hypothetical protein